MVKEKQEVEIIPWSHAFGLKTHAEVVAYVKSLPKNSFVAIEATQEMLDKLSVINYNSISKLNIGMQSLLELVIVCRTRNIAMIPIERRTSDVIMNTNRRYKLDPKEFQIKSAQAIKVRDQLLSSRIANYLTKNPKVRKLFVLTGGVHAAAIATDLEYSGFNSKINYSMFSDPNNVAKFVRVNKRVNDELTRAKVDWSFVDPLQMESMLLMGKILVPSSSKSLEEQHSLEGLKRTVREKRQLDIRKTQERLRTRPKLR